MCCVAFALHSRHTLGADKLACACQLEWVFHRESIFHDLPGRFAVVAATIAAFSFIQQFVRVELTFHSM